ncbi:hypothetical protein EDB81DRAFT_756112 [Dactylonectria macrodidyma]|uniref:Uncharacterized protein n=1 Tax=Dactylonectria macrodidyma TaxID=307937 RepID=A0A9P9FGU7_9HYPO|nr:hypothetical protein EDB81DRAFT_756112 [Dactylonectria macrodidyma]
MALKEFKHYDIWRASVDKASRQSNAATTATESLTPDEKAWLRKHYRNEFKFLQSYALSIHNEEDREEGRVIMRAMVSNDEDDVSEDEEDSDEFNPEHHFADHKFSEKVLDWIEAYYGNSMHFMLCYGLKFYNDEDCEESQSIVRVIMSE